MQMGPLKFFPHQVEVEKFKFAQFSFKLIKDSLISAGQKKMNTTFPYPPGFYETRF
jgi:hypothetical protein